MIFNGIISCLVIKILIRSYPEIKDYDGKNTISDDNNDSTNILSIPKEIVNLQILYFSKQNFILV